MLQSLTRAAVATCALGTAAVATPLAAQSAGSAGATTETVESPSDPATQDSADRVLVTAATRTPMDPLDAPYSGEFVPAERIRQRSYRTLPQVLRDTPGVLVQETGHGQGSPYIRGFTSFRTLLTIDGVRLNHSAFREGPNQYWATVDAYSLDSVELVKGPSSVLYGSDAIGGTVAAVTRSPYRFGATGEFVYGGTTVVRYADAENSLVGRGEVSLGYTHENGARTGLLMGGTVKHFDDLEGGADVGTQPTTGYEEIDYDIKFEHFLGTPILGGDERFVFLHQRTLQNDAPRTHSTVDGIRWRGTSAGSDLTRALDQERRLSYLQYHADGIDGAIDGVHANLSLHQHDEIRNRVRGSGSRSFDGFELDQLGAWLQLESPTKHFGDLVYGVEYYHDEVDSFSTGNPIQGPVGDDASYDMLGVYLQSEIEPTDRLRLTLGARYNYLAAKADSVRDPISNTRIEVDDDWDQLVGSARFRYALTESGCNVFGGVSQGFRAPNLSDLTRFDVARSSDFEIPSTGLRPEDYVEYEIGVKLRTTRASIEASYFYIDIEDRIVRFPTGNTNADGDTEVTRANVGDGFVYGVEFGSSFAVHDEFQLFGNITYLEGKVDNFTNSLTGTSEDYLSRLMPLTLQAGIRWDDALGRGWAESVIMHANDANKLSFRDTNDTQRIPPGGTPGYTVWHLRGGLQLSDKTDLVLLLENVTDVDYRVHGSGLNRPGRNFVVSIATRF